MPSSGPAQFFCLLSKLLSLLPQVTDLSRSGELADPTRGPGAQRDIDICMHTSPKNIHPLTADRGLPPGMLGKGEWRADIRFVSHSANTESTWLWPVLSSETPNKGRQANKPPALLGLEVW